MVPPYRLEVVADKIMLLNLYWTLIHLKLDYGCLILYLSTRKSSLKLLETIHQGLKPTLRSFNSFLVENLYTEAHELYHYQAKNLCCNTTQNCLHGQQTPLIIASLKHNMNPFLEAKKKLANPSTSVSENLSKKNIDMNPLFLNMAFKTTKCPFLDSSKYSQNKNKLYNIWSGMTEYPQELDWI